MSSVLQWLILPWSGACDHHIPMWMAWHGRLMVLAWAICAPLGVLLARYYKVWPGQDWPRELDRKTWWHLHRGLQGLAVAAVLPALMLAVPHASGWDAGAVWHARFGWAVVALAVMQVAGGMLRGTKGGPTDPRGPDGDHYQMTRHRVIFEHAHKGIGYLLLVLALAAIGLGLVVADAPRWMALMMGIWWLGLGLWARRCQRKGLCLDTYQAIWGPSASLPGAAVGPIGLGITRRSGDHEHGARL